MLLDPAIHIAVILAVVLLTMAAFAWEKYALEVVALSVLAFLLVFYQVFPVPGVDGRNQLSADALLSGFSNTSLVAVVCLLVIGQGLVQTNALRPGVRMLEAASAHLPMLGIAIALAVVLTISGLLNNTPLVIIFIPIMQALASQARRPLGSVMMPLSYVAILGGMTTVVGSSTNLLVSSALTDLGHEGLGFFSFLLPGSVLAIIGFAYVMLALPRLLPVRESLAHEFAGTGKQFIAELHITDESAHIGAKIVNGRIEKLPDMTVRQIHRGDIFIGPPFDTYEVRAGDILLVAATRESLSEILASASSDILMQRALASVDEHAAITPVEDPPAGAEKADPLKALGPERVLGEIMIAPASRLADRTLEQIGWGQRYGSVVLGIQRRARMVRGRLNDIRLQPGDVLLIIGSREAMRALENSSDFLVLARSMGDMPTPGRAPHAVIIFLATVGIAALGYFPIAIAAVAGAAVMIMSGCLNIRQAVRAIDRKIVLLVAASLAMGLAMQATGAAEFVAQGFFALIGKPGPEVTASLLFLIVAIATNFLSNNACAVLFTPIAVSLARTFDIDPHFFAITVVLAANCSFASPIGYQTNLLVMGPGNYRFADFVRGGTPLVILLWLTYSLLTPLLVPSGSP